MYLRNISCRFHQNNLYTSIDITLKLLAKVTVLGDHSRARYVQEQRIKLCRTCSVQQHKRFCNDAPWHRSRDAYSVRLIIARMHAIETEDNKRASNDLADRTRCRSLLRETALDDELANISSVSLSFVLAAIDIHLPALRFFPDKAKFPSPTVVIRRRREYM